MEQVKRHSVFRLNKSNLSILDISKGFINLRFLQKLHWMKTEWEQARIYSLVYRFAVMKVPPATIKSQHILVYDELYDGASTNVILEGFRK